MHALDVCHCATLSSCLQDQDAATAVQQPDVEAQLPPSPTKEEQGEEKSMETFFKEVAAIKVG
jgi:hypothetical protein